MSASPEPPIQESWYAVLTTPRHEKTASQHLEIAGVEVFLPTYESIRVWKNRQKVALTLPLFPTYLFVRISDRERVKVLSAPGVRQIVGSRREPLPLKDGEVEALRKTVVDHKVEPYLGLVAGQLVRVKSGLMQGVEGHLVRQSTDWRFVISVQLINQHASIEVEGLALEPVP